MSSDPSQSSLALKGQAAIPPSPSEQDYRGEAARLKIAAGNAVPIFDRDDPISLFGDWMNEARESEPNDSNAMSLATVDANGAPDVRIVLLKGFDEAGFVFYSNSNSAKGQQLAACGSAAICLHWKSLRRQVRARGAIERVSDVEADAYFGSRARVSQLGAWASDQSQPLASREAFEADLERVTKKFEGRNVTRPPHWYGWRVKPERIEFWRDRPFRLHDRLVFNKTGDSWTKSRLYP